MSEPTPIRDGVIPELDLEREMIDYVQKELRLFAKDAGQPPTRIAVIVTGKGDNGKLHTRVNSWDAREEITTLEHCSMAAALFMQRATEE